MSAPENQPSIDVVLDNLKVALEGVDNAVNALDTKALFVAGAATTIIALVAPSLDKFPLYIIVVYLIIYLSILVTSYLVYGLKNFMLHAADPKEAEKDFLALPEPQSKAHLLDILGTVYKTNSKVRDNKANWLHRSFQLLNAFILLTVVLIFFPVLFKGNKNAGKSPTPTAAAKSAKQSGSRTGHASGKISAPTIRRK